MESFKAEFTSSKTGTKPTSTLETVTYSEPCSDQYEIEEQKRNKETRQLCEEILTKEKKMDEMYGDYVDNEPCLPQNNDEPEIQFPDYMNVMDKISIKSKILELASKEERAKEMVRFYRDRCSDLKCKILQIESEKMQLKLQTAHEKNQIRHFWRNKVIEGQSRSGRILRLGLDIRNNKL